MSTAQSEPLSLVSPLDRLTYLEAALFYAKLGLPVLPLDGKVPLMKGSRGLYDATTRADTIRRWWREHPAANIGIPTGKLSGWWVLDVDARHHGFTSLERLQEDARIRAAKEGLILEPLEATLTAFTGGGGLHIVYRVRNDLPFVLKNKIELGGYEGIDLKVDGGYIVVAPSLHESGARYRWLYAGDFMDFPGHLARFPDILADLAAPPPLPESSAGGTPWHNQDTSGFYHKSLDDLLHEAVTTCAPGTRHRGALRLAGQLKRRDIPLHTAQGIMLDYARSVPQSDHPYPEADALLCLQWVYDHCA